VNDRNRRLSAARVDHRFKYGDTIRLGPLAVTAHVTGGHTRGCTSWSFGVGDVAQHAALRPVENFSRGSLEDQVVDRGVLGNVRQAAPFTSRLCFSWRSR
jgi:hypothetical protein